MAMAIAYRAGSNLKSLSLTDWDVLRIDRHTKKVIFTVVAAYLTFPCVGAYLALLALRRPALVGSTTKRIRQPRVAKDIIRVVDSLLLARRRALPAFPRT